MAGQKKGSRLDAAAVKADNYDFYLVGFSGGKDSVALVLDLLESGVPSDKIELHHHLVDGRESDLFDWPVTSAYCRAFAAAFGLTYYESWKVGGIEGEMNRFESLTAPTKWESEDGTIRQTGGVRGNETTRHKYPALSANLQTRWCSSSVKIEVMEKVIANEARFQGAKVLVLTGERREESTARSKYAEAQVHGCETKTRTVHHHRRVIDWTEDEVWAIMERHNVRPHVAYLLGWGRLSCMTCIFGNADQWASVQKIAPATFAAHENYETEFNHTIRKELPLADLASKGTAYPETDDADLVNEAMTADQATAIGWTSPAGRGRDCGGPS
jgi:3'-phosphoadenosine 5'-phosphosulfate sulfotransferase (PAPS reductase)/FAD synthetase